MQDGKLPFTEKPGSLKANLLDNRGFSLIAVIIAIAVVAVIAGAVGPMAYRQILKSREANSIQKMNTMKDGFLSFFEDTGRFPTEAEGIAALVVDPGVSGWQGPYLSGEPSAALVEFAVDGFGQDYIIEANPTTDPAGETGLILVSSGIDQSFSAGSLHDTWTLNGDSDDLIVLVNSDPLNRKKSLLARDEMQAIGDGAQDYFYDKAAFPTTIAMLAGSYMDESIGSGVYVDPWGQGYVLIVDNSLQPQVMVVRSSGPDQADDSGAGDDISLQVGSVIPGRKSTYYMLNIIQAGVDGNSGGVVSGDWEADRDGFGFGVAFASDGWGNLYEEAMSSRTVLSGGPDGDYFTAGDNIPPGVVPDDEGGSEAWDAFGTYTIGDVVSHDGSEWECRQSHTGSGDLNWAPGVAGALWLLI